MNALACRFTLRDLPLAARLVLSVFLISVSVGYLAALVQLHFQHARPGELLPTGQDAVATFHGPVGDRPPNKLAQVLEAPEDLPFSGTGQMRTAFVNERSEWRQALQQAARALKSEDPDRPAEAIQAAAEQKLRQEREGERLVLVAWASTGGSKQDFTSDAFILPPELHGRPITRDFLDTDNPDEPKARLKSILDARCVRCHNEAGEANRFPMEKWDDLKKMLVREESGAMSLNRLAQTTHVHLLSLGMLYGLLGFLTAFSSAPALVRLVLGPWPLVMQLVDCGCWWLARLEQPYGLLFASLVPIVGGMAGLGLLLQVLVCLFSMYGRTGKGVLVFLLAAAVAAAGLMAPVVERQLVREKTARMSVAQE